MKTLSLHLARLDTLSEGRVRTESRWCEHASCTQRTRDGKPFCLDHVEDHPYVQALVVKIAEREAQDERVKRAWEEADLAGVTAREILLHLDLHGARTEERLVRELHLDLRVVTNYLMALSASGQIVFGITSRGSRVARLASMQRRAS